MGAVPLAMANLALVGYLWGCWVWGEYFGGAEVCDAAYLGEGGSGLFEGLLDFGVQGSGFVY